MPREAAVRLTLSNAQFITEMKHSGDVVQRTAQQSKKSMDAFGASADKVKGKIQAIGGAASMVARNMVTLGGAFTVATSLKEAVMLQRTYRQIAFGVKDARGQLLRTADVQRVVERSAAAASQKNAAMAQTFRDMIDATGDVDFAEKALTSVGTVALGTGEELGSVARAADQLHEKFGITADGMLDALAQVFGAAKQGGPKFEELAALSSNVGAELLAAGLEGKRGFDFMLGALVQTKRTMKDAGAQAEGLKALLRSLSQESSLKGIAEKVGLSTRKLVNEKDVIARIRSIFSKGKAGADKLMEALPAGEQRQVLKVLFTDPFEKALAEAQKAGLKGKAAIDRALLTFDQGISEMGRASMSGAEMQKRADAERQTPEAQLTAALNTLATAMSQPAIITAINDLAKHLPKLAEHIASFVSFAAEHPFLAGAGALGAKAGGGALMDLAGNVIGEVIGGGLAKGGGGLLKKMLGKKAAGGAAGAAGAAGGALGEVVEAASGIQRYHQFGMAGGITAEMLGGGGGAITAGELGAAGIPAAGSLGAAAATLLGVGAAGAAGFGAGYLVADHAYSTEGDVMKELQNANAAAAGGGTRQQKQAALDRLRRARAAAAKADIGEGPLDAFARLFTDVDSRKQANDEIWSATQSILKLQQDLAKPGAAKASGTMASTGEINIVGRTKVDPDSTRAIGQATAAAIGSKVLDVRITNVGEMIIRGGGGPGGSRGPMRAGEPRQGGGV